MLYYGLYWSEWWLLHHGLYPPLWRMGTKDSLLQGRIIKEVRRFGECEIYFTHQEWNEHRPRDEIILLVPVRLHLPDQITDGEWEEFKKQIDAYRHEHTEVA